MTVGEVNAFARHFMCVLFSCVLSLTGVLCSEKDDEDNEEDIDTTPNTPAQSVPGTPADQSEDTPPPSPKSGQRKGPVYDKNKQRKVKEEGDDAEAARKARLRKPVDEKKEKRDKIFQEKRDVPSAPANRPTVQNLSFDDIAERLDRLQDW